MIRKIFIALLMVMLSACATIDTGDKEKTDEVELDESYIEPLRDVFLFDELSDDVRTRIKDANLGNPLSNAQIKMLGMDAYNKPLKTIDGIDISLKNYDRIIMEVVSVECSHCKKQVKETLDELSALDDCQIIQYFDKGDRNEIMAFYDELEMKAPEDAIIISRDDGLHAYLKDDIKIDRYPCTIAFLDGKISFSIFGEYGKEDVSKLYDISFENILKKEELADKSGTDVRLLERTMDDVKRSFSVSNRNRLNALDNDLYSDQLTYQCIGTKLDFSKLMNENERNYISEIEDFGYYADKELALIYTYFNDESETDKVEYINSLIDSNPSIEYVVVLIEGFDSSSVAYENMDIKLHCKTVSTLGRIPEDFFRYGLVAYPTAMFVQKGTFTGAYSNIESVEKFNEAIDMFLGEDSIALKRNN